MGERKREGSMWVMAEDKEKWKRQSFCLASSDAREDTVGEQKAKPRVRQTEARVGRRDGCFSVPSLLPLGVLLEKGPHGPSRGEVREAGSASLGFRMEHQYWANCRGNSQTV